VFLKDVYGIEKKEKAESQYQEAHYRKNHSDSGFSAPISSPFHRRSVNAPY
jgi:hypothetical protein